MNQLKLLTVKLGLLVTLALPTLASAQGFNYNGFGDVLAGFRKVTPHAGLYELVVDLGNVTNFIKLPVGTTINITNYTATQITNAFLDTGGYQYLQWSVFSAFVNNSSWTTPLGTFPANTLWLTVPSTSLNLQTQPPTLGYSGSQKATRNLINGVGAPGATQISNLVGGAPNTNNNPWLIREPVTYASSGYTLSEYIGDTLNVAEGDFGSSGSPLGYVVENVTPSPFTTAQRSDFYELVPNGSTDPVSGVASTNAYYLGYFTFNLNGTETFTRGNLAPAITSATTTVTNGFAPLQAVFNSTATGTISSWVWNFGNGTILTNTTGTAVTNIYSAGGPYTVTLTTIGPAGSSTDVLTSVIVASPAPKISSVALSSGKLLLAGTNGPAGVQYRILTATNLTQTASSWTPVSTNTFLSNGSFSYTSAPATNKLEFFQLVSP